MKGIRSYLNVRNVLVLTIIVFVLGFLVGTPLYLYSKKQNNVLSAKISSPEENLTEDEIGKLVAVVGKLVILPEGEKPEIATVSNVEKLQNQSFFLNARNGDKVLVYLKARKAYLYRPSDNKVVDIAPVNLPSPSPKLEPSGTVLPAIDEKKSVVIYNGANDNSILNNMSSDLAQLESIDIQGSRTAERQYESTIIVDLSGDNSTLASEIAAITGGRVGSLPTGEVRPEGADILVILGSN